MRHLHIAILAGEKTCTSEPGTFCPFVECRPLVTVWMCALFDVELPESDGRLLRLPECLEAEKGWKR